MLDKVAALTLTFGFFTYPDVRCQVDWGPSLSTHCSAWCTPPSDSNNGAGWGVGVGVWGSCLEWRERLGTVVTPTQIPGSPTWGHPYQCTQSPNPSTNPKLMTLLTTPFSALHPTFRKIYIGRSFWICITDSGIFHNFMLIRRHSLIELLVYLHGFLVFLGIHILTL